MTVTLTRPGPQAASRARIARQAPRILTDLILAYVIMRPVSSGEVLYPALVLVTILSLASLLRGVAPPRELVRLAVMTFAVGAWGTGLGFALDNPGAGQVGIVWLGGCLIWGLWAAAIDRASVRRVFTTVCVASLVLSAFIVVYVGTQMRLLPAVLPDWLLAGQGAGFDGTDGSAVRAYGLSSLVIVAPIMAAAALLGRRGDPFLPPRWLSAVAALACVAAALLGGRRAIAVVTLCTPLLIWLVRRVLQQRQGPWRINLAASAIAIAAIAAVLWGANTPFVARVQAEVSDSFTAYTGIYVPGAQPSIDDLVRIEQAGELTAAWSDAPAFGRGFGTVLDNGYTRSLTRPWAFELQYHQLLMTTGVLGVLGLATCLWMGIVLLRRAVALSPDALPAIISATVGCVALLVANATNPYLQAVGHQWGVAFALGVAGAVLGDARGRLPSQD